MLSYKLRSRIARGISLIRPRPVVRNLGVDELLANTRSLSVVEQFNDLYYRSGAANESRWCGVPILKNPCDLWMISDLITSLRPRVIVETGTHHGGSALYFADIARLNGLDTEVITVDFNPKWSADPEAKGVISMVGYSTDSSIYARVVSEVESRVQGGDRAVLVLLDSDHSYENVLNELRLYSALVTPGSYIIVEDTNINGHPSSPDSGPGPYEAVEEFLRTTNTFDRDLGCQKHLLTFNPGGYLRRKRT
jgi:cephalosporin hydroxylase